RRTWRLQAASLPEDQESRARGFGIGPGYGSQNLTAGVNYFRGAAMPKVINIEPTPNPDALKFIVQKPLLKMGTRSFKDFGSAVGDPLASSIFALGKVTSVFYMDRFVTVNKESGAEWSDL